MEYTEAFDQALRDLAGESAGRTSSSNHVIIDISRIPGAQNALDDWFLGWTASCLDTLARTFGKDSAFYVLFKSETQRIRQGGQALTDDDVRRCSSLLSHAAHAYSHGNQARKSALQAAHDDIAGKLFAEAYDIVEPFLRARCPLAHERLHSAYDRFQAGTPEGYTHVMTSCRRALQSVADAVYPAQQEDGTGQDGKSHPLTEAAFKNRLNTYLRASYGRSGSELQNAALNVVDKRLEVLVERVGKGVHSAVTRQEASLVLIHTYLFIAEVARASQLRAGDPISVSERPDS